MNSDDFSALFGDAETLDPFDALLGGSAPVACALDAPISLTIFADKNAITRDERSMSLRHLAAYIPTRTARAKANLPWLKLARFGDLAREDSKCLRTNENMLAVSGVEIDYDAGAISIDDAITVLREQSLAALIYSTPSAAPGVHKWRALFPFAAEHLPEERDAYAAWFMDLFDGKLDKNATMTRSQAQHFGQIREAPVVRIELVEGLALDRANLDLPAVVEGGEQSDAAPPDWPRIRAALSAIPPYAEQGDSYGEWIAVAQALHHASGGDEEGYAEFAKWSAGWEDFKEREARSKWRSFGKRRSGRPITIATLFDIAGKHGWEGSAWNGDADEFEDLDPLDSGAADDEPATKRRRIDPITRRLNKRHAVVSVRGRTLVATDQPDGGVDFGTVTDLDHLYANDRYVIDPEKKKTEAVSKKWLRDPARRTFPHGVTFAPGGASEGTLNLWRGWAVEPDADASCALILTHVRNVVAAGDEEAAQYILAWMAHLVQRPGEKPGVALVLRGAKGAGKDSLGDYLAAMIGRRHVPTVADSNHITGRFNARLEAALLLHVQEGVWAGDRQAESVLKYLVTSDQLEVERKGIDSFSLPSVLRLFISSNADWTVPASTDERRWAVFDVSDERCGDEAYFKALRAEMNGQGPGALLHYLTAYDLTGFNVRRPPDTVGLRNQKLASLKNVERWWFDALTRGELPGHLGEGDDWRDGVRIGRDALRTSYIEWMRGRRFDGETLDERLFGRRLREMVPEIEDTRPRVGGRLTRMYRLPPLQGCRESFAGWLRSEVDWDAS